MKSHLHLFALAMCILLLLASPAFASSVNDGVVFGSYIDDFIAHWKEKARNQNTVVVAVLVVGAIALFIITRSKGPK